MNAVGATGFSRGGNTRPGRRLYLIAAMVLAALIPLLLFAGMWVRTVLNQNQRELGSHLVSHAANLSAQVDAEIKQQFSVLRAIALVESLDEPDLSLFHATAKRMIEVIPQWAAISLIDPATGRQLMNTMRSFGESLPETRHPDIIRQVAERREPRAFSRYPGESAIYGRDAIFLAVPVLRDGSLRAVLVAALKAEALQQVLDGRAEEGLLTVLVDERERILARSQEPEVHVGRDAGEQLRAATHRQDAGLFTEGSIHASFQRSPITGWLAVAAIEQGRLDGLSDHATWTLFATGGLALTLAGVLAVFLFYNVVERRISDERYAASRALSVLDARLLTTTQDALAGQRKAATEREVLLREIYHRVKNNLQIVQSLLRLGSRDLREDQREPFESAIRRIGAMAQVHSLLYRSPDLASIDLKDYLEDLVRETAAGFEADPRGIRTEVSSRSMRIPLDTAVPLAFITVELLSNAFRHAFPDHRSGMVRVCARQEGDQGVLSISDDGIEVPEPAGKRSFGLTLVTKLVEQIGGRLEAPPPGHSTYRVLFPLTSPMVQAPLPEA